MPRQYPKDLRDRAVRLVPESRENHESEWSAIQVVASGMCVSSEALRRWMRQADVDAGLRPGVSTAEQTAIRRAD